MSATLQWLGQSGYAVGSPRGEVCLIDPYLSDYVEEELGTARVVPAPIDPQTVRASVLVATHWHPDHLDPPACRMLARTNPELVFVGPPSIVSRLGGWGVEPERIRVLERGGTVVVDPFTVHGVFARHDVPGWLAEDALGLVLEVEDVRIYHSGDTEYDARILPARDLGPFDLGVFVINGSGGNMNALEAALLAHQLEPEVAVPSHYGMWAAEGYGPGATLDPGLFVDVCARLGGPPTRILPLGDTVSVKVVEEAR